MFLLDNDVHIIFLVIIWSALSLSLYLSLSLSLSLSLQKKSKKETMTFWHDLDSKSWQTVRSLAISSFMLSIICRFFFLTKTSRNGNPIYPQSLCLSRGNEIKTISPINIWDALNYLEQSTTDLEQSTTDLQHLNR